MADEQRLLGVGSEIEFEGKTYTMAPLTYELQAKYVAWLKKRAVMSIKEQREYLTDEEYKEKMDNVDRNMAAGVYGFGGKVCVDSVRSMDGLKELVRLTLAKNYPEVNHEFIDRLFETKMEEATANIKRDNANPLLGTPPTMMTGAKSSQPEAV